MILRVQDKILRFLRLLGVKGLIHRLEMKLTDGITRMILPGANRDAQTD
jgi:hypothetical protein